MMGSETRVSRAARRFSVVWLTAFLLASCQSDPTRTLDGLEAPLPLETRAQSETIGSGGDVIALFLAAEGDGSMSSDGRAAKDGASLAIADLGDKYTRLNIIAVPADLQKAQKIIDSALLAEPAAIISNLSPGLTKRLLTGKGPPPLFDLTRSGVPESANAYGMAADVASEAGEAIEAAMSAGGKRFFLGISEIYPPSLASDLGAKITKSGGSVTETIIFPEGGDGLARLIHKAKPSIERADVSLVLGESAAALAAIRQIKAQNGAIALVGTSAWPADAYAYAETDGAVIVTYQRQNLARIASRFRTRFGYPLGNKAASAYDATALISGLIRANGKMALSAATLTAPTGFSGTTGLFRFNSMGRIERKTASYLVRGGGYSAIEMLDQAF